MNNLHVNINDNFLLDNSFLEKLSLNKKSEIIIDFISNFKSAKILRKFISNLSDKLNIDNIWKSRLILIADELNNNAIEYWSKPWELNCFKIYINFSFDEVIIKFEVIDKWNWIKSKTAKEMILLRNKKKLNWFHKNNWIRWRGLFMIIERLVDELYFKDSDKWWLIVWINKVFKIKKTKKAVPK